jgi:hypothetical protein
MKKFIFLFIGLYLFNYSYSQERFSIKGVLRCDSTFVKNTAVKLFYDTIPIQATITNEKGFFIFENIQKEKYTVKVISVFYNPISIEIEPLNNIDLGVIELLEASNFLPDVEIIENVEPINITNNGVILNVANTPLRDIGNALSLLNYAPVVFISDNATQFESGGLEILVNGKTINIPVDKQELFLKSISSQNIETIEIIDKPDASVAGNQYGKINIILKNDKGLSGDLEAKVMYHKTFFQNYNTSLFYNSDKIRMYSLFNIDIRQFLFEEKRTENRNGLYIDKQMDHDTDCSTPDFLFGADYPINDKSSLGMLYSFYYEKLKQFKHSEKYTLSADYLKNDSLIGKESNQISKYFLQTITLNYYLKTDTLGSNFSTSVDYAPDKQSGDIFNNFSFWSSLNSSVPSQIIDYKYEKLYNNNILSYNAQYNHVFKNSSSLNFGTKLSYTSYNDGWDAFNLISNDYIFDEDNSQKIIFNEYIAALFSGYKFQYRKSFISISARGEYNFNKYKNNDENFSSITNWIILPTFLHNITINKNNRIYYYFTEKIYRPSFHYYIENSYFDPISQKYGNSKLKPQNQYILVLGYILRNKYSLTLQAYKAENMFLNLPEISGNSLIYKTINGGVINSLGVVLDLPFNVFDWWKTNTNISGQFRNNEFKNNQEQYISNNFQGSFSHSSYFTLFDCMTLSFNYSYNSKNKSFFIEQSDVHNLGAGINYRPNDDFVIGFNVSDILNSVATNTKYNYFDMITGNSNYKQVTSRTFMIRIAYSFSIGKEIKDYSTRESGIENEKSRIQPVP